MPIRHRLVNEYRIYLPDLCAWCGQCLGTDLCSVQLRYGSPLFYLCYTLKLPICSECEDYVRIYQLVQLRLTFRSAVLLLPLALWLVYGLLGQLKDVLDWLIWLVLGGGGAWLAAHWLGDWLARHFGIGVLSDPRAGSPPPGYTGWGDEPVQLTAQGELHFSSSAFQRAFLLHNPNRSLTLPPDA